MLAIVATSDRGTNDKVSLHEMLDARLDDVIATRDRKVRCTVVAAAIPTPELVDHVPDFVDEIRQAVIAAARTPSSVRKCRTAAVQGAQHWTAPKRHRAT